MIPTLASCSFDEIVDEVQPGELGRTPSVEASADISSRPPAGQNVVMQLYVNKDHAITEKIVRHAEERGVKGEPRPRVTLFSCTPLTPLRLPGLFITVDAPQLGRREKDMRVKFEDEGSEVQKGTNTDKSQGAARAISSFIDPGLCWKDIEWFKTITKMPIILKGVQCWEDAVLAAEAGLAGVVLSNHGGRQLVSPSSCLALGRDMLANSLPAS